MTWLRMQMALVDVASTLVAFAANWLLQSTLLIAAGLLIVWLARRRGAAVQSAIYRTTLAALVVCPLATLLLSLSGVSGWSLTMPAAWKYAELPAVANAELDGVIETAQVGLSQGEAPATPAVEQASRLLAQRPTPEQGRRLLYDVQQDIGPQSFPQAAPTFVPREKSSNGSEPAIVGSSKRAPAVEFQVRAFGFAAMAISLAWLLGTTLLVARLAVAWWRLRRMLRSAAPAETTVQEACRQAAAMMGVTAPKVVSSPFFASPCLVGWPRAAILLPEATPTLPLRDVLVHELAHLRRGDAVWNLLARLTEALFFFQPLVWLLSRRLEAAAEDVCDDYVVQFGGDRSLYARGLLEIAELATTPLGAPAVAMVSLRSILARRVTRILDPSRSLSTRAGNFLLALVIAGGVAAATIVGFVGLAPHPAAEADAPPATEKADEDQTTKQARQDAEKPPKDEESPKAARIAETATQPDVKNHDAGNELRGRILGSDGKPVLGAKLFWIRARVHDLKPEPPRLLATTGNDGGYRFAMPAAVDPSLPASWSYMDRIAITAPGHGSAFTSAEEMRRDIAPPDGILATLAGLMAGRTSGATQLPAAGEPIRGRLIDVNGQPVAGATVRIRWFNGENDRGFQGDLEARGAKDAFWQARVRNLLGIIEPVQLREVLPSATTDADGRFELRDIGQKRLVQLLVQGDGIEAAEIVARNEPGEKIVVDANWLAQGRSVTIYPREFLHAVGPSKPVEGRVLDLETGEPIAGAVVRAVQVQNEPVLTSREREHFAATTDAQGRYRITGLPTGKANKLVAFALDNVAYCSVARTADTSAAGVAAEIDFALKRCVWAEGRVFNGENDQPFTGEISYYFFRNQQLEDAIPGLRESFVDGVYWTNANGEFRVPVLPSRGILAFRYDGYERQRDGIDRFARGLGADDIAGSEKFGGGKWFPTVPHYLIPENYERVAEVAPNAGQETIRVDMPLFASLPLSVHVEAMGEPVTGFEVYGNERWEWQQHEGPEFEIVDLRPGERRKVFVFHRGRNLAGAGFVEHGAKQAVPIELVQAGSIKGRLVDADGEPIDDGMVVVDYEKLRSDDKTAIWARHSNLAASPTKIPVDKNGRFRLDGLVPGWNYHAYASAPRLINGQLQHMFIGRALKGVQVTAGEIKDLGDVVIDSKSESNVAAKNAAVAPRSKPKDTAARHRLAARVVDDSGRPVSQARVRVFHIDTESRTWIHRDQILGEARSDARGECSIDYSWTVEFSGREHFTERSLTVLADADGYAADWQQLEPGAKQLVLSLSRDDLPLEGRVLDLEGRPIQGVRVNVEQLTLAANDLGEWIEAAKQNPTIDIPEELMGLPVNSPKRRDAPKVARFPGKKSLWIAPDGFLPSTATDKNGRFRLAGLGRDRLVRLRLEGANIATTWLNAVTHEMPQVPYPIYDPRFRVQKCFGSRFDFTAEPDQPISGVVRDAKSGRALPGVDVRLTGYASSLLAVEGFLATATDEQGRYELRGVPKPNDADPDHPLPNHRLQFVPRGDQPYFRTDVHVLMHEGLDAVTCDAALKRAIWLRGRVTDAISGKPVLGLVEYYPFLSNKAAADYPNFVAGMHSIEGERYPTRNDGTYQLPALPGRGLVVFIAHHADRYPEADGAGTIAGLRLEKGNGLNVYHLFSAELSTAVRETNPAGDAGEAVCDIKLKPLDSVKIALIDPDGRPLTDVVTRRGAPIHTAGWPFDDPWSNEPLRAAQAEIIGPRDQFRTLMFLHRQRNLAAAVSLSPNRDPPRQVTLRACGSISGRLVDIDDKPVADFYVSIDAAPPADQHPTGFSMTGANFRHRVDHAQTDPDGRFRVGSLPPGIAYVVNGSLGSARFEKKTPVLESGQSLDLGDLVMASAKSQGEAPPAAAEPTIDAAAETQAVSADDKASDSNELVASDAADHKQTVTLRGRVVDPSGRPLQGAKLFLSCPTRTRPEPQC